MDNSKSVIVLDSTSEVEETPKRRSRIRRRPSSPILDLSASSAGSDIQILRSSGAESVARAPPSSPGLGLDVVGSGWVHCRGVRAVLLLDSREVVSRSDRSYIQARLLQRGVPCEVRQLRLGDMLWVARLDGGGGRRSSGALLKRSETVGDTSKKGKMKEKGESSMAGRKRVSRSGSMQQEATGPEYVTDYIVERKKASDLAASIVDGRYEDQKRRLHECICRRVSYVVEGELGRGERMSRDTIRSAVRSTRIRGFQTVTTESVDATVSFLANLHKAIDREIQLLYDGRRGKFNIGKLPHKGMLLDTFQETERVVKPRTVRETLGMQLRQVHGCSASRAEHLLEHYPTPAALTSHLSTHGPDQVANLKTPANNRALGKSLAQTLHSVFTKEM